MNYRELAERGERKNLSGYACAAADSRGRARPDDECDTRTCFQRDVDRVIHSKTFRRLAQKTQVFLRPEGDHYRTRLTHTLEVTRIARTLARSLRLNEDLAEACAMAHDLGHTPFGHAGEAALSPLLPGGFKHNEQSVRVLEKLERGGLGLNMTFEVLDGVLCHTGDVEAKTLEGRLIRRADRIAYLNADFDDACRAGILTERDLPPAISAALGRSPRERIDRLVRDLIANSLDKPDVGFSPEIGERMAEFRAYMFESVYTNPVCKSEESKAKDMLLRLFEHFVKHGLPDDYAQTIETEGIERAAADYIAGMTDRYAVSVYSELTIPKGWSN